jgi:hypothetical protein
MTAESPPQAAESRLTVANGRAHTPRTVTALCEQYAEVCESAVDPLEIASALELEGLGDQAAKLRYGYADVFALAQDMYFRVPRKPVEPELPPDPWQAGGRLRPVLHSLLYALPGVCFPAAIGLLTGPGAPITLIVALAVAWSAGQGLAFLGYTRLGRTLDMAQTRRVLRLGLVIGLGLIVIAMLAMSRVVQPIHPTTSVLLFGLGEGAYMFGAGVLLVLGAEVWLLAALAPGVLGSAVFLVLGRPPDLEHLTWGLLAATPVIALVIAVIQTRPAGPREGSLFVREEWIGAVPAVAFGLVSAGLLIFPVAAGPHGHGGINVGALLAGLPLSLSMGAAESSLLWYRRRTQKLMRTISDIGSFGIRARLTLIAAVAMYVAAAAALMALTVVVANAIGLAHWQTGYLPQMAAYLMLGTAMFLALTLQALGSRIFPLVVGAMALGFEILCRNLGVAGQIVACAELLIVTGGYATIVLGRAVRHAW